MCVFVHVCVCACVGMRTGWQAGARMRSCRAMGTVRGEPSAGVASSAPKCLRLEVAQASLALQAATELFEEQQRAAQQKKLEELEAMSNRKRSELVQNLGGSIKNVKMVGNERDDWDMFQRDGSEKHKRLAQLSENAPKLTPTINWDEMDNEPVNFFTKIQFGDAAKGSHKGSQLDNEHEAPQAAPVPSDAPPADQATANSPTAPSARHL